MLIEGPGPENRQIEGAEIASSHSLGGRQKAESSHLDSAANVAAMPLKRPPDATWSDSGSGRMRPRDPLRTDASGSGRRRASAFRESDRRAWPEADHSYFDIAIVRSGRRARRRARSLSP
jgi:hypothetical protein